MNKEIISQSFIFFKDHFKDIAKLFIPIIIVTSLVSDFLLSDINIADTAATGVQTLIAFATYIIVKANFLALDVGFFLYYMKNIIYGLEYSKVQLFYTFIPKLPYLFILTTLAAFLILVSSMFFLIPGIWLAFRFSYAWMYLIFDALNPIKALYLSFIETKGELMILGSAIAIALFVSLFALIFYAIFAGILLSNFLLAFSISILATLVFLFIQVMIYRIYSEFGHNSQS